MLRKNGLVLLADGKYAKIIEVKRFKNSYKTASASFSESGITSVTVRMLNNKLLTYDENELQSLTSVTKAVIPHDLYAKLKSLSSDMSKNALERVWERQDEAQKTFIDDKTFAEVERLDVKTLRSIAEQEGVTLEAFIDYARKRQASERE